MSLSADEARLQALLAELAGAPGGMSLPRLCKRLGLRMSVLLRTLAWLGEAPVGDVQGTGWVRTFDVDGRTLAQLTPSGHALVASLPHDAGGAADPAPDVDADPASG